MKAKLTISRPTFGDGKEVIAIHVKDASSGVEIAELHIGYAEFTQALTGQSEMECDINRILSEANLHKIGKKKIVANAYCERTWKKDEQEEIVLKDFAENYSKDGWELYSDGTTTQQNGEDHKYTLVKWEELK